MLLTEQQAKEKKCHKPGLFAKKCTASSCMAWRFCGEVNRRASIPAVGFYKVNQPAKGWKFVSSEDNDGDGDVWVQPIEEWEKSKKGYCGLVGLEGAR